MVCHQLPSRTRVESVCEWMDIFIHICLIVDGCVCVWIVGYSLSQWGVVDWGDRFGYMMMMVKWSRVNPPDTLSLSLPHSVSLSHFCRGQLFRFKCDWVVRFESISWPDYTIEPNIHELLMSAEKSEVWKWGVYAFDTGDYVCLGFRSNDICDCSSGTLSVGPNER